MNQLNSKQAIYRQDLGLKSLLSSERLGNPNLTSCANDLVADQKYEFNVSLAMNLKFDIETLIIC